MMSESHEHWTERLSDYLDESLDPAERSALEAHLAECGPCRTVLAELRTLVADAHRLGDVPPARDLWPGIAAAIAAPLSVGTDRERSVIQLPTAAREAPRRSGVFLTMPQLAAASIVLAIVSAAATMWAGPGLGVATRQAAVSPPPAMEAVQAASELEGPSPELSRELATLEEALDAARGKLEPNTVRILEKNLGVIERAIDESRRALALDPGNEFLREHLDRAYHDKVEYLRQATSVADWAS